MAGAGDGRRGRARVAVAAGAAVAALLAGCAGGDDAAGGAGGACRATVGVMAPVTGDAAQQGIEQVRFARLAIERFNREHGTQIAMTEADTGLDPAQASTAAQRFISDGSVVGIVGPASSQQVEAIGPLLARSRLAAVSASATGGELTTSGRYPTFSRVVPPDTVQGPTDAEFMVRDLHARKVVVIDDQTSYSTGIADIVERELRDADVAVQRESVDQAATDYSSLVSRLAPDTDVVFLPWLAANAQQFGQQLREQGKPVRIFGADGLFSPGDFQIDGSYVSAFAPDIRAIPQAAGVVRAFEARYGAFGAYGPPSYAAATVLATAIASACADDGAADRDEVTAAVRDVDMPTSILGRPLRFTAAGDLRGARFFIYRVEGGRFRLVDR